MTTHSITDKRSLIEDIISILMDPHKVHDIEVDDRSQSAKFTVHRKGTHEELRKRMVISWNNQLDFVLWEITGRHDSVLRYNVDTSRFFRVGKEIELRHLAAEKLKRS
jgi:hypothetical protein